MTRWLMILVLHIAAAHAAWGQEIVIYTGGSGERAVDGLLAHGDVIDVIAPQAFGVRADGIVQGRVDERLLAASRDAGIRVMPLIHNPGFNQEAIHGLLDDPVAQDRMIDSLVAIGRRHAFWGWQ